MDDRHLAVTVSVINEVWSIDNTELTQQNHENSFPDDSIRKCLQRGTRKSYLFWLSPKMVPRKRCYNDASSIPLRQVTLTGVQMLYCCDRLNAYLDLCQVYLKNKVSDFLVNLLLRVLTLGRQQGMVERQQRHGGNNRRSSCCTWLGRSLGHSLGTLGQWPSSSRSSRFPCQIAWNIWQRYRLDRRLVQQDP